MMLIKIKDNKMTASSAGIPPIYIYRSETKSVEEILIKGMPLGGSASFPYKKRETNLSPGDTVLLMSDGFPELFNDKDEMLDYPRVKEIFKEAAESSVDEIVAHLFKAGERWSNGRPQDDDITFVVLKVKHNTDLL
jgi:serine phosphatase RsbU (regulator of sigma subunit)